MQQTLHIMNSPVPKMEKAHFFKPAKSVVLYVRWKLVSPYLLRQICKKVFLPLSFQYVDFCFTYEPTKNPHNIRRFFSTYLGPKIFRHPIAKEHCLSELISLVRGPVWPRSFTSKLSINWSGAHLRCTLRKGFKSYSLQGSFGSGEKKIKRDITTGISNREVAVIERVCAVRWGGR